MALIGNYSIYNKLLGRLSNGSFCEQKSNFSKPGYSIAESVAIDDQNANPVGYGFIYSFVPPLKEGSMGATALKAEMITNNLALESGFNLNANLNASISETSAALAAVINMAASLAAQGLITSANLSSVVSLAANISASGTLTTADIQAIVQIAANISSSGSITSANMTALANMSANISSSTELSPTSLANAVWDTTLSEHLTEGSTGEKLNKSLTKIQYFGNK